MTTFYELRMLNKMSEYSIKENARKMLQAYDHWKTGRIDEAELGRLIRLSPENRAAVIQTMIKTPAIMQRKPQESKFVLAIIEMCGEIVSIADKPPRPDGFPSFLKLPTEIRLRIYHYYLKPDFSVGPPAAELTMVPRRKIGNCPCAGFNWLPVTIRDVSLALTSKRMRDEFLSYFYRVKTIFFLCACELGEYLRTSTFSRQHIHRIKFQWIGPKADKGISQLKKCPELESLTVVVARSTMRELTRRETDLRNCFSRSSNKRGFPEALGFEELSALRGLKDVDVEHANRRRLHDVCSAAERTSLQQWLEQLKTAPKDD